MKHKKTSRRPFSRRSFVKAGLGAMAAVGLAKAAPAHGDNGASQKTVDLDQWPLRREETNVHEALIIGSGFGGSVTACRLSARWPGKVMVVERGKRYGRGEFPRGVAELAKSFWHLRNDGVPRPLPLPGESRGLLDLRSYNHMDTMIAAGYGGGSLIYGNGIIEPESPFFDQNWPAAVRRDRLRPYWDVYRRILGATTIPRTDEPARRLDRLELYERLAAEEGLPRHDVEMGVFFGNDPERPTPMGQQETNRFGALQTSCTYCAECVIGCNVHAKNSTDLNYLYVAENRHGLQIKTESLAEKVVPLDAEGNEDPDATGRHGFRIYLADLARKEVVTVLAKRVLVAAGTYGSTEFLMRNRDVHETLPRVSERLGRGFSGNGDFLSIVLGGDQPSGFQRGPTVIQYIDHHLIENADPRRGFIRQDMTIPTADVLANYLLDNVDTNWMTKPYYTKVKDALNQGSGLLLQVHVGLDRSNGVMRLDRRTERLRVDWPFMNSMPLYESMVEATHRAKQIMGGWLSFALPTWFWPLRRNMTVHPLGGCGLAETAEAGVTSAWRGDLGRVFGYENLFVADGALMPSALGANPSLTIGALAEMIAEDITGREPSLDLL